MADRRWRVRRARDAARLADAGPRWGRWRERRGFERRLMQNLAPDEALARRVLLGQMLAQALVALAMLLGWWVAALLLHLAACLALPLLARLAPESQGWTGGVLRLVLATQPALGPLAAAGALVALLAGLPGRLREPPRPLPEDPLDARLDAIAAARAVPPGLLSESLGDVLRWGHARQKARALELAAEAGRHGGGALLLLAQSDPDPAVRGLAEALRPDLAQRLLQAADAERRQARGATGQASRSVQRRLARALDAASQSGLLEAPPADACRAEAAGLWQSLAEPGPDSTEPDAEAELALGRNLLALGDLAAARLALEAAVTRPGAGAASIGWLADCLFQARDFAALEALVQRWRPLLEAEAQRAEASGRFACAWRLWLSRVPA